MSRVSAASSCSARPTASTKLVFSRRSSGGYPLRASSGRTTSWTPSSRARPIAAAIFPAFPRMSPTVASICARAMRSGSAGALMIPVWLGPARRSGPAAVPEAGSPEAPGLLGLPLHVARAGGPHRHTAADVDGPAQRLGHVDLEGASVVDSEKSRIVGPPSDDHRATPLGVPRAGLPSFAEAGH